MLLYAGVLLRHVAPIYADWSIKRLLKVSLEQRILEGTEAKLMNFWISRLGEGGMEMEDDW